MVETVIITNFRNSKYYGVYDNAGTWTQAGAGIAPTHFAVLDVVPTANGSFSGVVNDEGDEITAVDFIGEVDVVFTPNAEALFEGVISDVVLASSGGLLAGQGYVAPELIVTTEENIDVFLSGDDFDISFGEDIVSTDKFDTLLYTLIFTDARATRFQVENSYNRRGWLGDLEQKTFRSKVWLKDMSRNTVPDLAELTAYVKQSLLYMVENKICDRIEVDSISENDEVKAKVVIYIGNDTIEKFVPIWRGTV